MIERREEKDEAGLAQALDGEFRTHVDGDAKGFEDIGGAAARSDSAVAVLGHFCAGCGCDQSCAAGNVEGLRAAAAGAHAVHQLFALAIGERKRNDTGAHDVDEAGELRRLLAAGGHYGKQCGGFHFRNLAGKNLSEDLGGLLAGERAPSSAIGLRSSLVRVILVR